MSSHRTYSSSLRDRQARATKLRIRQAARELYASKGFSRTTIAEIADRAGVAPATIYAAFESKAGLVVAMLEAMEEGVGIGEKLGNLFDEEDPHEQLRMYVAAHCDLFANAADILRAATRAIEDPEVAALAARGDGHRREVVDRLTSRWMEAGALRRGLTQRGAGDRLWLLTTVEGYLNAVDRLGWAPEEYRSWLTELAEAELLEPA